jgi:hypothetical protein
MRNAGPLGAALSQTGKAVSLPLLVLFKYTIIKEDTHFPLHESAPLFLTPFHAII